MNVLDNTRTGAARVAIWAALSAVIALGPAVALAQVGGSTGKGAGAVMQTGAVSSAALTTQAAVEAHWTPQRLLNAKPLDLHPAVGANGLPNAEAQAFVDSAPPVRVNGAAPTAVPSAQDVKTLIPETYLEPNALAIATGQSQAQPSSVVEPNQTSSYGANFTTYRVFPDAATVTYPNTTAGKLFFHDPRTGYDYVCSASVLRQRIVVTAGHCVTSPSTDPAQRYFYTNFMFVPAYRNGYAPLLTWTARTIWVTTAWYYSDGSVPNAQDVGMLVMNDNAGRRIYTYTGFLGYWTGQLSRNHLTMLGYPVNLDNGLRMEINHAQTYAYGGNNTYTYGSAMRGGSSGGPWIIDYGVAPSSNPYVALGGNYLAAVTSYGPVATEPKYQGASNLDSRFISLLTAACAGTTSGNCNY